MRPAELLQDIRMMKLGYVYERFEVGELSQAEAGELGWVLSRCVL